MNKMNISTLRVNAFSYYVTPKVSYPHLTKRPFYEVISMEDKGRKITHHVDRAARVQLKNDKGEEGFYNLDNFRLFSFEISDNIFPNKRKFEYWYRKFVINVRNGGYYRNISKDFAYSYFENSDPPSIASEKFLNEFHRRIV